MRKTIMMVMSLVAVCVMTGCQERKGTMERAGERADEIVDNAKDGDPLFHKKGAAEKAGEAIDDAFKGNR